MSLRSSERFGVGAPNHSEHLLDAQPDGRFPLQNFLGVRIHFLSHKEDTGE